MRTSIILILLSCAALIKSDHIEYDCRDVQCPQPDYKCPADSELKSSTKSTDDEDDADNEDNDSEIDPDSMHFLRKRSLQHREPIKIVAEDVDRFLPELSRYHNQQQSHRKRKRDLVISFQAHSEAEIKECCPEFQCVCKTCPNVPKCSMGFVAIIVKEGLGLPGSCCPTFECVPQWECNSPNHPNIAYYQNKCTKCECFGDHELCQKMCEHMDDESSSNCFSSYHKRLILNGDTWSEENGCKECKCVNGNSRCEASFCKALNCPNPMKIEGRCCSVCPSTTASTSTTIAPESSTEDTIPVHHEASSTTSIPTTTPTTSMPTTAPPSATTLPADINIIEDNNTDFATPTITVKYREGLDDKQIVYIVVMTTFILIILILFGTLVYFYVQHQKKKTKESFYSTIPSSESSQTSSTMISFRDP